MASDARPIGVLLEVIVGLVILALFCAFVLPRATRWVFAGVGQHRGARFLFVVVALTAAALVADRAGIEGIVGAFFAGLALNRLVPARSRLMEQIEFVGGVLLIPFFLLSTGMLIDPAAFTEVRVIAIACLSLAVVFVGKATAAALAARVLGLERPQRRLLYGLSLAQAAATLAAVTIGVEIGLFDSDLLNATLVVVLVTVLVSSIVTRNAARRIEPPAIQAERLAETVFVPVDVVDDPAVVELAARLAMAKGGTVLVGAVAAGPGRQLEAARARADAAERQVSGLGAEASSVVRIDSSEAAALSAIVAEHDVSLMVTGWKRAAVAADFVLGGQDIDLVALATRRCWPCWPLAASDVGSSSRWTPRISPLTAASAISPSPQPRSQPPRRVAAPSCSARTLMRSVSSRGSSVTARRSSRIGGRGVTRWPRSFATTTSYSCRRAPGRSSLPRDAVFVAGLPVACTVAVATRPRAGARLVTGTATLVASRRSA